MSDVTITDAWPKPGEAFTVSDLDRMPDHGHRHEPARLVAKLRGR